MIQAEVAVINEVILHRVGQEEIESVFNSEAFTPAGQDEAELFRRILLKPFANHASTFEFTHAVNLEHNVLFRLAKDIFEDGDFVAISQDIALHLVSVSKHPNIKEGDLFVARFADLGFGDKHYKGLGIYKFEDKESFLETSAAGKQVRYTLKKGIGGRKPDKACLVLLTDEPYTLLIIDNGSGDTDYWQNEFIKHKPKNDFVNNTNDVMDVARNFIIKEIPQVYEVTKADQIGFLNRSVEYFKTHETFSQTEFEHEVFHHEELINSYRKFDGAYREENQLDMADNLGAFQIFADKNL